MTPQKQFRMPATGEVWRHYKGDLYTIVGLARDDQGFASVVYTDYDWQQPDLAPLFTQSIGRFLQEVENGTPRFKFSADATAGMNRCQYIDFAEVGRNPKPLIYTEEYQAKIEAIRNLSPGNMTPRPAAAEEKT